MAAKISELGEGEVRQARLTVTPQNLIQSLTLFILLSNLCSDVRLGDDITLDISQSSGTVSPPQETRARRKKTQTSKMGSNPSGDQDITGSEDDGATACDDQTGNDKENLLIWR